MEVRDTKSVTVRILRPDDAEWESVTPNARVDDKGEEPIGPDGKGPGDVLDNT